MTVQDKLDELKNELANKLRELIRSKEILKNFKAYDKAWGAYADFKSYVKQKNLDPKSEYIS